MCSSDLFGDSYRVLLTGGDAILGLRHELTSLRCGRCCGEGRLGIGPEGGVVFLFVVIERGCVAQGEADVIEAIQQAVFAKGIDLEARLEA